MALSSLILVIWAFLQGAVLLGWFTVTATILGILLIGFSVVRLLEIVHPFEVPVRRAQTTE